MKIKILAVGKIKEEYFRDLLKKYSDSINKKAAFEIIELPDEKTPENASEKEEIRIKEKEGNRIIEKLSYDSLKIALDISGKRTDSEKIKKFIKMYKEREEIVFIIGGSLGLDERILRMADFKISFSDMTFPHQMIRVLLAYQISISV